MSYQQNKLREIAEALRTREGTTEKIRAALYAQRVLAIQTEGGSEDTEAPGGSSTPIKPVVGALASVLSKPRPFSECGVQDLTINSATVTVLGDGSLRIGG